MKKEEIIKKAINDSFVMLANKYHEERAAMMAAVWRGDVPERDKHRKVLEGLKPEIQAECERIFSWAVAQLKTRYTGGAVAYGRGRGRVCAAPSYAAPIHWLEDVEARAVLSAPSWETYASPEDALRDTIASIGKGNTMKIMVRDRPDPNDNEVSTTTVVETKESKSLFEAIKKADPKWGLTGFGQWKWYGEEISPETQAEMILLQGESPLRGQWDGHKWQFDIA